MELVIEAGITKASRAKVESFLFCLSAYGPETQIAYESVEKSVLPSGDPFPGGI